MVYTVHDNPELDLAFGFLQNTSENVFLTGRAGTGKTTFLHNLKKISSKRMVILAPTGVAAINAGGVTIHSFFQMPFGPWIPGGRADSHTAGEFQKGLSAKFHKFNREKLNIIRSLDLMVIDEISMVRSDLLDGIDELLRRFRDRNKPFGGVQLLMIGDLQQLAPVVKEDEWEILKEYYATPFFFGSRALMQSKYITIELKRIYRQSDQVFINLLNKIRDGDRSPDTLAQINKRYHPQVPLNTEGCIMLTTHNHQAKRINEDKMKRLPGKSWIFSAKVEGEFPEYAYPTDLELEIRIGAQVMFVKNDSLPEKRYFNGKIGTVQKIDDEAIYVQCPGDSSTIQVEPDSWQNARYGLDNDTGEIVETVIGTFSQYPLKAAWAITIHKSQGLTFDQVMIDAGAAFAHGQVYVALSRCRTLEGLTLISPLAPRVLISNHSVSEFSRNVQKSQPGKAELEKAVIGYQHLLLRELFDFYPLKHRVDYIRKMIEEARDAILPSQLETLLVATGAIESELVDVAARFRLQIDALLVKEPELEKNAPLQDRIHKACSYFIEKTVAHGKTLLDTCSSLRFDNKDFRKSFDRSVKLFEEEWSSKLACLEACCGSFTTEAYLEARSKATIQKPAVKKPEPEMNREEFSDTQSALYQEIKLWRSRKASTLEHPEYMILHNKAIVEISIHMPSSMDELKRIKGVGKRKLKQFGTELLEIVSRHSGKEYSPDLSTVDIVEKQPVRKEKVNTKKVSLHLFRSGKGLEEIAAERKLTLSTIERHMSHFISIGELSIDQFIPAEKVSEICDYFSTASGTELNPAKEHFGERVSYGELHMVLAYMRFSGALSSREEFAF